jgi:hypothetical protein
MKYICINDNFEPLSGIRAKLNEKYIYFVSRIDGKPRVFKSDLFGVITSDNSTEVDNEIFSKHFMQLMLYKIKKLKKLINN